MFETNPWQTGPGSIRTPISGISMAALMLLMTRMDMSSSVVIATVYRAGSLCVMSWVSTNL
jgi:hypothetical protein